ncbi:MAG: TonB-dependent receptor [Acidobacteriota bacterium]|nr:MAG: TonB-dependent receptor [Acidobacteriota bacterium]
MIRRTLFLLVLMSLFGLVGFGQSQSNSADLLGVVKDQTGAVLPGATVTVRGTETGLERTTLTDDVGAYRILVLPPGVYEVRAEMPGFATKVLTGVHLTVGQYANLNIEMELSATETEVFVSSDAEIVERQKTVQASTIEETQIDNLPINGRDYLNFTLLVPGSTTENSLVDSTVPQAPTSGLSFGGQDSRSNSVTIDGVDNMDSVSNGVRATMSQDAIQEFQISRNSYSSEFGRARGGVVNIVSKSGTNSFHGNGFFFFRNNSLDARNTFSRLSDPPFSRYEFGGTVGGPIVQDKTFFFTSFERLDREESRFVTFMDDLSIFETTQSQKDLFGFLSSTGILPLQLMAAAFSHPDFGVLNTTELTFPNTLRKFESESGIFPFEADQNSFSFKLDHRISSNNDLFVRFNLSDLVDAGANFGGLQGVSNGLNFDISDIGVVVSDTHVFSASTLNDFKFQTSFRTFGALTNDPQGPEIAIASVAEFGRQFLNPTGYDQNQFQFADNFTMIRGNHTLKLGTDLNVLNLEGFAKVFMGGQFSFAERIPLGLVMDSLLGTGTAAGLARQLFTPESLGGLGRPDLVPNVLTPISSVQSYNFGLPISYFQGFGDPNTDVTLTQLAFFLQDNWRVSERFTLNLGLRYDTDWRPETQNVLDAHSYPFGFEMASINDRNNFSPRLGFAWDPFGDQKTVIRGGAGIFYQNFFQAFTFVSQVLSGQISQVFLPITGLPGIDVTSADVFAGYQQTGSVDENLLAGLGVAPGTTPSVILPGAANVVNPYSIQTSFGIERELARDWSLSLDYVMNRGQNLIRSRDINVRAVGDNEFELPALDPRFAQVNMLETSGRSSYHGFTTSLRKRFAQSYSFMMAYTFGKGIDDTTDFGTALQPNNQVDLKSERGLSAFDQRHRVVFSGIWQSPWSLSSANGFAQHLFADWTVSPIVTLTSGRPFNVTLGYDANNDTHEETDRPRLRDGSTVGRHTGRGPSYGTTDLRISRKFPLPREAMSFEFIFEAFNLFNNVNYSGVNRVIGRDAFALSLLESTNGHPEGSSSIASNRPLGFTSAFDPRQIQFGFRFNF